ncbi:glycosyltransferase [Plectonema cf. radiosum LEGE 06105]|uniref:Glycosyltransferase n=1 Tax=Plectonema cf. radiosum LEGE 06105 TaxID=945769 RepID=A0A8J7K163_9CYAN|nr:glycosyltransferase [Plectonema radiosum]MBE9214516.1 glycosyltransferase [Plectonema cf. radiosum LEGE 06105]
MKILYFQAHPVYGATENYVYTLAQRLNKADFQVGILYPDVPALQAFSKLENIQLLAVKSKYFAGNLIRYAYSIAKEIRKFDPDIIHINDPSPLGVIAARLAGVKKVVITHHTPELKTQYNWKGNLAKTLTFKLADYFIFTSEYDQEIGSKLDNIPAYKSKVIAYGLDMNKFSQTQVQRDTIRGDIREKLQIPQKNIVIGSAGRLEAQKAQLDLIKAANIICFKYDHVTFVLVGEGSLRTQLATQINNLGLSSKFLLPGFVNNIEEFLCAVDIFTMSSLFEGLCYAVVEAAAMSVPVVATAVGGMRYSVADNETGFLIEPRSPEKLAEKINFLIDNPDIAQQMGEKGRKRFMKLFTVERMISQTEAIYYQLLENNIEKFVKLGINV